MMTCLLIVSVDWKFLGYVTTTSIGFDFRAEIVHLRKVRRFREAAFQVSWFFAFVTAIVLYASGEDHRLVEAGVFTGDGAVRRT
jgi:hypothetical protein